MPSTQLLEAIEDVKVKRGALKDLLDSATNDDGNLDFELLLKSGKSVDDVHQAEQAMTEAAKRRDDIKSIEDSAAKLKELEEIDESTRVPVGNVGDQPKAEKSLGQEWIESDIWKNWNPKVPSEELALEKSLKALFQTTAGFAPDSPRSDIVIPIVRRPVQLLDNIRQVPIALEIFKYMEQTTRSVTGTRLNVAEGAVYNESTFVYEERSVNVIKKGVFLEATEEQFADVPMIENMLAQDLPMLIGEAIDDSLVNAPVRANAGDNDPEGLLNVAGTNEHEKGDDEAVLNSLLKGIEEVEFTGRANADMMLLHTRDYYREMGRQDLNGRYIVTDPQTAMTEFRPWGVLARKVDVLPAGTAVVGDFGMYALIRDRQDVRTRTSPAWAVNVTAGASTQTTRPTGRVLIYTDVRLAWAWLRKAAFTKVTNLS